MSDSLPFQYVRISKAFLEKLVCVVEAGESILLVGPRYGGKRHVMRKLCEALGDKGIGPIVRLRGLEKLIPRNRNAVTERLRKAVEKADPALDLSSLSSDNLFAPIDLLYEKQREPVVLFAPNVDNMPHHVARSFLQSVRNRVQDGKLIVVLSGEDSFRDLVYGPNSEFTCANQYVLQGFDPNAFKGFFDQYAKVTGLTFQPATEAIQYLWEQTGGNAYLLRMALWAVVEWCVKREHKMSDPVTLDELRAEVESSAVPYLYGANVQRYTTYLMAREPASWTVLEDLLEGHQCVLRPGEDAPGALELAAIAVRENNRLKFASPIMKRLAGEHFGYRRMGDLYARNGDWDKAFERYKKITPEERIRPASTNDRGNAQATAMSLAASMYSKATDGPEKVKGLLEDGCRYVLGFQNVIFWTREGIWKPRLGNDETASNSVLKELSSILPSASVGNMSNVLPIPDSWNQYVVGALFESVVGIEAVIIGDADKEYVLSRERRQLVSELLDHFLKAYRHAVTVEQTARRLETRNKHLDIITFILDALGRSVLDVRNAIEIAANGLRGLGYRRVLFCLVDPQDKHIKGFHDSSDGSSPDVSGMADYSLGRPKVDVQPYVIHTRMPIVVPDARLHPLTNKNVVEKANMKALAVVPILASPEDAIGTIHVERSDGAVPTSDEVADLMVFGGMLAGVIRHSERVNLLQRALDKIPEPIVIVDSQQRIRYGNEPSKRLLGVAVGWQKDKDAQPVSQIKQEPIREQIKKSLAEKQRFAQHVSGIFGHFMQHAAVMTDSIEEGRDTTVGAVLHIQDLSYVYSVFEAFKLIAESTSTVTALEAIVGAAKLLGHHWARLYLVDKLDPDCLVSRYSFGFDSPESCEGFERGETKLLRDGMEDQESWWCLKQEKPLVFCWKEALENGEKFTTGNGLEAVNVKNPKCPEHLAKHPGDFWIDFPLFAGKKAMGKITLDCDPQKFHPDDFELLTVLSRMTSSLLDAFLRRERQEEERDRWVREAAEETMANAAHSVKTRLAALPVLLTRFRLREKGLPDLVPLNDSLQHILNEVYDTLNRVKERLSNLAVHRKEFDLLDLVRRNLEEALLQDTWTLESTEEPFSVSADPLLVGGSILELIQNSKDMTGEKLRLAVSLQSVCHNGHKTVRIVVTDNGPGIPVNMKDRIFEQFFSRRPGSKPSTGLGLTYVRKVVLAHGGSIREIGRQGEGARFMIEIPRHGCQELKEEDTDVSLSDC